MREGIQITLGIMAFLVCVGFLLREREDREQAIRVLEQKGWHDVAVRRWTSWGQKNSCPGESKYDLAGTDPAGKRVDVVLCCSDGHCTVRPE